MMNEKAQAFSTFQLLISAIVAVAILTILLGVLDIIPIFGPTQDPVKVISDELSSAYTSPATMKESSKVLFDTGTEHMITKRAIIKAREDLGITEGQICFGKVESLKKIEVTETTIKNNGSKSNVKFAVICDNGNALMDDVETHLGSIDLKCEEDISNSTTMSCAVIVKPV